MIAAGFRASDRRGSDPSGARLYMKSAGRKHACRAWFRRGGAIRAARGNSPPARRWRGRPLVDSGQRTARQTTPSPDRSPSSAWIAPDCLATEGTTMRAGRSSPLLFGQSLTPRSSRNPGFFFDRSGLTARRAVALGLSPTPRFSRNPRPVASRGEAWREEPDDCAGSRDHRR